MRRLLILLVIINALLMPVSAMEFTAPAAPDEVQDLMPPQTESFGEGLWKVICAATDKLQPQISRSVKTCVMLISIALMVSILQQIPSEKNGVAEFSGCIAVGVILLDNTGSMIRSAVETIDSLSEYGKMFLPVMAGAQAAQGGWTSSAALYTGTMVFDAILGKAVSQGVIPLVYMYLALSVAGCAMGEDLLKRIRELIKWLITWCLKNGLYIFTGYLSITRVVSGATDAAKLKAAKLTISSAVPVVGGILSDASEAVLVGAGMMKNAAGIYGMLTIAAIWISPFLHIGIQYLMLKVAGSLCAMLDAKRVSSLIDSFSTAMGFLLGMTGIMCILLLISTVCFMKEVG